MAESQSAVHYQRNLRRLTRLIGVALAFFGALLICIVAATGWSANRQAVVRERQLVENALDDGVSRTLDEQKSIAWWDDAVTHLANDFDPTWARENVGAYLLGQAGFDLIFIVDHTGRPVFSAEVGQVISSARYDRHAPIFAPMVARLRAEERLRPRPTGPRPDGVLV